MEQLSMNHLENCFNEATAAGAKYIGIAIRLKGTDKKEIIINPAENFDLKLGYYKQAYDENLNLKNVDGISILGFTYGDSFEDIENDLLNKDHLNNLNFGQAIAALKDGKKIARIGWNGKGMYIQLHKGTDFEHAIIEPFLVIKNVENSFNTWVPSISDLLAEDWEVV